MQPEGPIDFSIVLFRVYREYTFDIVILQRKIPARDWSKSRHVTFTNKHCCPVGNSSL